MSPHQATGLRSIAGSIPHSFAAELILPASSAMKLSMTVTAGEAIFTWLAAKSRRLSLRLIRLRRRSHRRLFRQLFQDCFVANLALKRVGLVTQHLAPVKVTLLGLVQRRKEQGRNHLRPRPTRAVIIPTSNLPTRASTMPITTNRPPPIANHNPRRCHTRICARKTCVYSTSSDRLSS